MLNDCHAAKTAAALGIAVATLYKRIREWDLKNKDNPVYAEAFVYDEKKALDAYIPLVFRAALEYVDDRPTQAIANLNVSQGYFYKIMKQFRQTKFVHRY
jgi:hypothetical protein